MQKQTGGGNHEAAVGAEMARLQAVDSAQTKFAAEKTTAATEKVKADQATQLANAKAAKKAGQSKFSKYIKSTKLGQAVSSVSSQAKALGEKAKAIGISLLGF